MTALFDQLMVCQFGIHGSALHVSLFFIWCHKNINSRVCINALDDHLASILWPTCVLLIIYYLSMMNDLAAYLLSFMFVKSYTYNSNSWWLCKRVNTVKLYKLPSMSTAIYIYRAFLHNLHYLTILYFLKLMLISELRG